MHGVHSVLLTDITYLKRRDGQFSYLSAIMDAGTKEILAHVVSESINLDFVLETLNMLLCFTLFTLFSGGFVSN